MKIGLVARADNSGLGIQTLEFYRHMQPDKTMVVDISALNNNPIFKHRYPERAIFINNIPSPNEIKSFLEGLDVVFIAEAAYNPHLYELAREMGVKTAVQYNYEFMDWVINPAYPRPDMLIAPSRWHYDEVEAWCLQNNVKHIYLHCPVARDKLPFREIKQARTFLHMAGRSAAHDRNGTATVIKASRYLTSQAKIVVHFQGEQGLAHQATNTIDDYKQFLATDGNPDNLTIVTQEVAEYQDIYAMGDVLLLPRRYGGNCLPLNEALSVGMPVIMTDISPNNALLPKNWLIPAVMVNQFTPRTVVDIYGAEPQALAAKIDEFYNFNESQMRFENITAGDLAKTISWDTLKPKYLEAFEALCTRS